MFVTLFLRKKYLVNWKKLQFSPGALVFFIIVQSWCNLIIIFCYFWDLCLLLIRLNSVVCRITHCTVCTVFPFAFLIFCTSFPLIAFFYVEPSDFYSIAVLISNAFCCVSYFLIYLVISLFINLYSCVILSELFFLSASLFFGLFAVFLVV